MNIVRQIRSKPQHASPHTVFVLYLIVPYVLSLAWCVCVHVCVCTHACKCVAMEISSRALSMPDECFTSPCFFLCCLFLLFMYYCVCVSVGPTVYTWRSEEKLSELVLPTRVSSRSSAVIGRAYGRPDSRTLESQSSDLSMAIAVLGM